MTTTINIVFQTVTLAILAAFYSIYFGKMVAQNRRGIRTDQLARGKKSRKLFTVELSVKIATVVTVAVEIGSIALNTGADNSLIIRILGAIIGVAGVVVFAVAVRTMSDSWRAGIPETDRTELVTKGIFRLSRNPTFLAFDAVYLAVAMIFFNPVLLAVSLAGATLLHLQIIEEEHFLAATFGEKYENYRAKTRRYVGTKRTQKL
jgi:protein-S-isoprenylcysteine O-methyltransferase Ste14